MTKYKMQNREHIVLLYSHNPSRLFHLRKIATLKDKYSFSLVADTSAPYDILLNFVDNVILIAMNSIDKDFQMLCEKIAEIGMPEGIVNISEVCVPLHHMLAKEFGLIGPSLEVVETARNKFLMRTFSQSIGIPVPKFVIYKNNQNYKALNFPVVAKPIIGGGSTLVRRFETEKELIEALPHMQRMANDIYKKDIYFKKYMDSDGYMLFLIEEIVGGETQFETQFNYPVGEISVESICFNGQTTVLTIHDKPIPSNGPYFEEYVWSTPSRMPEKLQEKAYEYVSKIHTSLGTGCYVLHTEFRTFDDDLILLEFGARLGGGPIYRSLLHATQNDYIEILIDLSRGIEPKINKTTKIPTITHCLWAEEGGIISSISGESKVVWEKYYVEHQLYDDIGDSAVRAPRSCRSNGHIVYQDPKGDFNELETQVIKGLDTFLFNLAD